MVSLKKKTKTKKKTQKLQLKLVLHSPYGAVPSRFWWQNVNRCNIPTASEKCFKTLLAGSSNKKYAQINLYKDRKTLKEFMAYLIHILKESLSMKTKPKDVIENFVIAVLQIKLMFNNLPHNVRVRQVNYVNSDISTALLLVLVIQQS